MAEGDLGVHGAQEAGVIREVTIAVCDVQILTIILLDRAQP